MLLLLLLLGKFAVTAGVACCSPAVFMPAVDCRNGAEFQRNAYL